MEKSEVKRENENAFWSAIEKTLNKLTNKSIYLYDECPLGFERDHLLYLMSSPLSPLKLYVFVGDSSGKPNCDRFCHRIGTTDQFCLQWHYLGAR